jgi:formylmethanofuran dehydrogenase subunit B
MLRLGKDAGVLRDIFLSCRIDNAADPVSNVVSADRRKAFRVGAIRTRFEANAQILLDASWGEMTATPPDSATATAWVNGKAATFDVAVAEAARLVGASVAPLFAHLGTDVAGAREAVLLAEHVGGVLDHAASEALIKDLDPVRETGGFETTPTEAATRADLALWVGPPEVAPDWLARPASGKDPVRVIAIGGSTEQRMTLLAQLRARIKQRPLATVSPEAESLAAALLAAKFGVAGWSAAQQAPLVVEAIHGLVRDLSERTRFSTLAAPAPDNGDGVQTVCGWMTGFPLRTGFARGRPEHDPWRYDSERLVAAGEVDCRIWISAHAGGAAPAAAVDVALCAPGVEAEARVRIDVAQPGADCDAILYDPRVGTLVVRPAAAATDKPSVATTLAAIRAQLGGAPC